MSVASERKAMRETLGCRVPEYGDPPVTWRHDAIVRAHLHAGRMDLDQCLHFWRAGEDGEIRQCTSEPGWCQYHSTGAMRSRIERDPGECFVYLMACQDRVKIGLSSDPDRRAVALSSAVGVEVVVEDTVLCWTREDARRLESIAHMGFGWFGLLGEWFEAEGVRPRWPGFVTAHTTRKP